MGPHKGTRTYGTRKANTRHHGKEKMRGKLQGSNLGVGSREGWWPFGAAIRLADSRAITALLSWQSLFAHLLPLPKSSTLAVLFHFSSPLIYASVSLHDPWVACCLLSTCPLNPRKGSSLLPPPPLPKTPNPPQTPSLTGSGVGALFLMTTGLFVGLFFLFLVNCTRVQKSHSVEGEKRTSTSRGGQRRVCSFMIGCTNYIFNVFLVNKSLLFLVRFRSRVAASRVHQHSSWRQPPHSQKRMQAGQRKQRRSVVADGLEGAEVFNHVFDMRERKKRGGTLTEMLACGVFDEQGLA